ncbi:restriction endonuclease subunit S [Bacillus cereus]|uniref:restriction endonuclease subunit S n=1 Tax=Bacillus cereus group TaxID=86661 RepID=UPI0003085EFC|nr:restriction endonuclease subunit S [Bacillus cereus]MCC2513711.1 restriction endonuclease subunit S [Bacillus cereus]MDZ4473233.1 restriction endonuclease subunit S [Bacillus cereus]MEB9886019.1 restriction endonuclease subunit S [Bacillus cereus]HDR4450419.1 restriction endonuclease subunit S [Bacillus cereus]HDR7204067.1 restriction endonuclease subunit S [Bacillus cereus]
MKNNHTPEIRFPGFTGDWEQCKLGDTADFSKGNGYSKSDLTDEGKPVILYGRLYTRYETVIESVDTFTIEKDKSVISKGNEVIVPASGETSEDISRASVVSKPGIILGGDLNIIRPSNEIDPIFLALTISNGKQKKELSKRAQGKSVVHLHNSDLKEVNLLFPKKEEQIKIGKFFKQLDDTIALHQQELTTLKQTKQGFLQKMFPKEGESVPEFRFPGFTGDWEQRRFENVLNKQDGIRRGPFGSALKKEFFVKDSDYAVYEQQNAIYDNYETRYNITKEKFEELKNFQLSEGDFILSGAGTIGRISRVPKGIKQGVFNQALIRFKIDENITDSEYFVQWIRSANMQRKLTGANPGSAMTNLVPMSEVKKWDVMVPSKNEQIKIGKFFKQLDEMIALQQRDLDVLKETKKAFLQKMFT